MKNHNDLGKSGEPLEVDSEKTWIGSVCSYFRILSRR